MGEAEFSDYQLQPVIAEAFAAAGLERGLPEQGDATA